MGHKGRGKNEKDATKRKTAGTGTEGSTHDMRRMNLKRRYDIEAFIFPYNPSLELSQAPSSFRLLQALHGERFSYLKLRVLRIHFLDAEVLGRGRSFRSW